MDFFLSSIFLDQCNFFGPVFMFRNPEAFFFEKKEFLDREFYFKKLHIPEHIYCCVCLLYDRFGRL